MRNLPKVTQLVSGSAVIHTQVCVMPRPILSTMRGQNMAQFCSRGSVMARFTLSPRYSAPLRKGAAGLVIHSARSASGVRMSRIRVIYHPASEEQSLVGEGAPPAHSPSHSAWKFPFLFTISQSLPGLRKDSRKVLTCLTLGHNS